jgi:hypothetical protein
VSVLNDHLDGLLPGMTTSASAAIFLHLVAYVKKAKSAFYFFSLSHQVHKRGTK